MSFNHFLAAQNMALLAEDVCLTKATHEMREEALRVMPEVLKQIPPETISLDHAFTAYFVCTYAHLHEKHAIKTTIAQIARDNMRALGLGNRFSPGDKRRAKPRIVCVTNAYTGQHVMHRVYGKTFQALRSHFETINFCLDRTDYEAAQVFDNVKLVKPHPAPYDEMMRGLVDALVGLNPDAILFGDIAMHPFTILLASLRLAPHQYILAGHPAPTGMRDTIDGFIIEDSYDGSAGDDFTNPLVYYPADQFACREPIARPINPGPSFHSPIRIVVPVSLHKITYPFLCTLRRIQDETGAELHITSNVSEHDPKIAKVRALMAQTLKEPFTLYPHIHYQTFLELIAQSDMYCLTFPFSGFSTVLDCISQGVPGVVMHGSHMAERQGSVMLERACDRPGSLVAYSEVDYVHKAVKLARDHSLREHLRASLLAQFNTDAWKRRTIFAEQSPGVANVMREIVINDSRAKKRSKVAAH